MGYFLRIKCEFNYGDTVYIKNDPEQLGYIVVGVSVMHNNTFYILSFGGNLSYVLGIEITRTKSL